MFKVRTFEKNHFFSAKMTVFTRWGKVTEIQHIYENHIYCSNFGSLAGGQNTKNRKIFVFLGTRISKIHTAQTYFSRRFKICNLILPSLLGNGRINMYFQRFWGIFFSIFSKFNPSDRRGRSQFKISPIPWLEHIPMEHLREKSRQIHCKTKKNIDPSESQGKKAILSVFSTYLGYSGTLGNSKTN